MRRRNSISYYHLAQAVSNVTWSGRKQDRLRNLLQVFRYGGYEGVNKYVSSIYTLSGEIIDTKTRLMPDNYIIQQYLTKLEKDTKHGRRVWVSSYRFSLRMPTNQSLREFITSWIPVSWFTVVLISMHANLRDNMRGPMDAKLH
jgi:hypothetical protein